MFRPDDLGCASVKIPPQIEVSVNKNKNKNSTHRKLALNKETVVHLTDELLKHVIGGSTTPEPTFSLPISKCC